MKSNIFFIVLLIVASIFMTGCFFDKEKTNTSTPINDGRENSDQDDTSALPVEVTTQEETNEATNSGRDSTSESSQVEEDVLVDELLIEEEVDLGELI